MPTPQENNISALRSDAPITPNIHLVHIARMLTPVGTLAVVSVDAESLRKICFAKHYFLIHITEQIQEALINKLPLGVADAR
jgi:hypothetical protein